MRTCLGFKEKKRKRRCLRFKEEKKKRRDEV
jgi:hypothetical protein